MSKPDSQPILPTLPRPKGWPPLARRRHLCAAGRIVAGVLTLAVAACVHGDPAAPQEAPEWSCLSGEVWVTVTPANPRIVQPPVQADSARWVCLPKGLR